MTKQGRQEVEDHVGEQEVAINVHGGVLRGDRTMVALPVGVVLFAHGSGSSRRSPRNRFVASVLQRAGVATLLCDLLTPEEARVDADTATLRFDIGLLSARLLEVIRWMGERRELRNLPLGLFGASTGAAAALVAAAARSPSGPVRAVVSRGGRPDLVAECLDSVEAPTLLIVGGADDDVLELNRRALEQLRCIKELVVVPGASHLFEERGALEEVARLGTTWFARCFGASPRLSATHRAGGTGANRKELA